VVLLNALANEFRIGRLERFSVSGKQFEIEVHINLIRLFDRIQILRGNEVKRYLLRSGIPCVEHQCIQCCIETRMPLSRNDILRIENLGYLLKDFAKKVGKEWRLKNRLGRCVFLSEDGCSIYSYRPEGCQQYPLVYDETSRKAVLDYLCPNSSEFKVKKDDIRSLMILLKRLRNEGKEIAS
jgi:Fe-S-cluster containining protein